MQSQGLVKSNYLRLILTLITFNLLLVACGTVSTENDRSSISVQSGTWPARSSLREGSTATFSYTIQNRASYPIKLKNIEPLSFQGLKLNYSLKDAGTGQILEPGQSTTVSFNFVVQNYTLLRYPFALGVYYSYGGTDYNNQADNYELALKLQGYDIARS